MDIEITPDQPKFCPRCHRETSLLVGAMTRHNLPVLTKPVDPVETLERTIVGKIILPAVLAVMLAETAYCMGTHRLEGYSIGARSAILLSGGMTFLTGLVVQKFVLHHMRRGTRYLEYERALENWRNEVELFRRLRICEECQVIVDDKEIVPFGELQEFLRDRSAQEQPVASSL